MEAFEWKKNPSLVSIFPTTEVNKKVVRGVKVGKYKDHVHSARTAAAAVQIFRIRQALAGRQLWWAETPIKVEKALFFHHL